MKTKTTTPQREHPNKLKARAVAKCAARLASLHREYGFARHAACMDFAREFESIMPHMLCTPINLANAIDSDSIDTEPEKIAGEIWDMVRGMV